MPFEFTQRQAAAATCALSLCGWRARTRRNADRVWQTRPANAVESLRLANERTAT
jgi:hypothetical protein